MPAKAAAIAVGVPRASCRPLCPILRFTHVCDHGIACSMPASGRGWGLWTGLNWSSPCGDVWM